MGYITLLPETTKYPITLMGRRAGYCWGADITDDEKNYKRGLECLKANHGRVMEYVNIEMVIDEYSARVIREWYTHIGGMPTRLQGSTRYINYKDFGYVIPPKILNNEEARIVYDNVMSVISSGLQYLENLGIPREDSAMLLPLGMETTEVDKRNLRSAIDMSRQRMCKRAYWEYRDLFKEYCEVLSDYSEEWKFIVDNYMMPKCEALGYCPEKKSCGRKPLKTEQLKEYEVNI